MNCPKCGTEFQADVCPNCGFNPEAPVNPNAGTSKWLIATLLCFFAGSLGVHRFYTGKIGTGIAMLLTCGGCGIWTLIDFIMILLNKYEDADGNLLK